MERKKEREKGGDRGGWRERGGGEKERETIGMVGEKGK